MGPNVLRTRNAVAERLWNRSNNLNRIRASRDCNVVLGARTRITRRPLKGSKKLVKKMFSNVPKLE